MKSNLETSIASHLECDTRYRESKDQEKLLTRILVVNSVFCVGLVVLGAFLNSALLAIGAMMYGVAVVITLGNFIRDEKIRQYQREMLIRNLLTTSCLTGEKMDQES